MCIYAKCTSISISNARIMIQIISSLYTITTEGYTTLISIHINNGITRSKNGSASGNYRIIRIITPEAINIVIDK